LLGRVLYPEGNLDDVFDGAAGGFDVMPDVAEHVCDLLLQRLRQLARARVRAADHARHDDVADAAGVGDRVLVARTRPVDAPALLHGQPSGSGGLLGFEGWHLGAVREGLDALGRQLLGVIQRRVDIALPDLTRQLVEQLDAVAVGIVDVEAVGHTMVDTAIEFDAAQLQERQLPQPRFTAWQGHGDVADCARHAGHGPLGRRWWEVGVLDQREVVMAQDAVAVVAAVEAHLPRVRNGRTRLQLAHLLETDDLGPELVRFFEVAHVEDQMVEANRRHSFVCHLSASFRASGRYSIERLGLYDHAPAAPVRGRCA